ncbi:hypothetical protein ACFCWV_00465 [Streptomyces sp. NPDC056341]|uniref:hypothetical protein n=1 Tax=Streptomyces sp. NPDC056341 TaxID=3345788 RepID=UPI0035E15674
MGRHSPRRARIVFYDVAREQLEAMNDAELARLDLALDIIAADPQIGVQSKNGSVRTYQQDRVRVVYVPTALGTLVLVAYVEA